MSMVTKAAPYLAIASTIAAKFLNPIEKAEAIIDKILGKSGDLTDAADELGTTPGKLARLEAVGEMKGLEPSTMRTLVGKFQTDLAQERETMRLNPTAKPGLLRNFVGEKDTAEAFFQFIQSLQKLSPEERTVAQTQVFGERIRGKASAFFNEEEFASFLARLPSEETYTKAAEANDKLGDKLDIIKTVNKENDFIKKSPMIKDVMINDIGRGQQQAFDSETETLKRYTQNKQMYQELMGIANRIDKGFTKLLEDTGPAIIKGLQAIGKFMDDMTPKIQAASEWVGEKAKILESQYGQKFKSMYEMLMKGTWKPKVVDKK